MTSPRHVAYLRPYQKDGLTRIFIQGRRVSDSGFAPGARFAVSYGKDAIEIRVTDGIGKKVHSKTRNGGTWPIIDVFNQALDGALKGATRLKAEFSDGLIRIAAAGLSQAAYRRVERLLKSATARQALSAGSLFHGLGVLDHALHEGLAESGVKSKLAFAVEREDYGLDASLTNNPLWHKDATAFLGDLDDIDLSDLPRLDILAAGIPCQGASPQGRTSLKLSAPELHPDVGHLFMTFLKVVERTEPGIVVIENVPQYANTLGFEMIRRAFERLGYALETTELLGNDFGALENRKRLVAIARSSGMPEVLPRLKMAPVTMKLADVLDEIALDDPMWKAYEHVHAKLKRDKAKAGNGMKPNFLTPEAASVPVIIKGYAETKSWQPYLMHPHNGSLMRKFTAREHARLKGIPETLIRGLPETVAHQLLGQSVIHPLFRAVGRAIGDALRAVRPQTPAQRDLFLAA